MNQIGAMLVVLGMVVVAAGLLFLGRSVRSTLNGYRGSVVEP